MSMKSQIAALGKAIQAIRPKPTSDNPPPEHSQFVSEYGGIDFTAWRAALDEWSISTFGEPLKVIAERIAEEEGF